LREIEFRGVDVYDGLWYYGGFVKSPEGAYFILEDQKASRYHGVMSESIGQFTGLTDSVGHKIFEGDILKITNNEWLEDQTEYTEVKYCLNMDYPAFDIPDSIESDECNGLSQALNDGSKIIVVDNIFDNPDREFGE
jgi:uncharacterized phage protein (TIGR01671 family)